MASVYYLNFNSSTNILIIFDTEGVLDGLAYDS